MDIIISPILPSDTDAVLKLYRKAISSISFSEYTGDILTELASRTHQEFDRLGLTRSRFVAKVGKRIVGYTGLDCSKARLTECYVDPAYAGQHVGTSLVKRVEKEASIVGIKTLEVLSSLNAVGFYKNNGFEEKEISYLNMNNGLKMRCMILSKDILGRSEKGNVENVRLPE